MLTNEVMAVVALAIVWLNACLIAAHALRAASTLGERGAELERARARGEMVRARVLRGDGEGGALAERRVRQIGRAMTTPGPDRIRFTDRQSEMHIAGGQVDIEGEAVTVLAADGQVWTMSQTGKREPDGFDVAWSRAATNKGVESGLVIPIATGAKVWLQGTREGSRLRAVLVATRCPISVLARGRRMLLALAGGSIATVAVITGICLAPPVFGTVSAVGGALMIAFFILVQPLAVMVQVAARPPPEQSIGGVWQRPVSG